MNTLLLPLLLAAGPIPQDQPRTYLLSIVGLPLSPNESIREFSFSTWGVDPKAVCRIPTGWRIKAGRHTNPEGEISGEGSNGITWYRQRSPTALKNLVLVTLYGPIRRNDRRESKGVVPATFSGKAVIAGDNDDRTASLSYRNIHLVRAKRCPA